MATDNTGSTPDSEPTNDPAATPASGIAGASETTGTSVATTGTSGTADSATSTAQDAVSFRASYPLDLFAHNGNNQAVMFITSQVDQNQLYIEISNNSSTDYTIPALGSDTVSANNYQIELRFRPGTLNEKLISGLSIIQAGWSFVFATQSDGSQSLFIMSSGALEWPSKGAAVSFTLSGVPVSGASGARVTRIELGYTNLQAQGSSNPLSGTRTQVIQIVDHTGTSECPFLFGTNGLGDLLNDGKTKNTVSFVLQTKTGKSIPISQQTKFILSFLTIPEGQTNGSSMAVATEDNLAGSVPGKLSDTAWGISKSSDQGITTEYILSPESGTTSFTTVSVPLTDLVTGQPNGRTPVSLKYQNVPGYWDGELTLWLEKSPLVRNTETVKFGTLTIDEQSLSVPYPKGNNNGITIGDPGGPGYHAALFICQPANPQGWPVQILDGAGNTVFSINYQGNIGVGKNSTDNAVDAAGDIASSGRYQDKTGSVMPVGSIIAYGGKTTPDGWLLCDGSVVPAKYDELIKILAGQNATSANTPDLRSRFIVGDGQGTGLSHYNIGQIGGEEHHTLSKNEMPSHDHSSPDYQVVDNNAAIIAFPRVTGSADWGWNNIIFPKNGSDISLSRLPSDGSGDPHNNLPPYYALTYIIKC